MNEIIYFDNAATTPPFNEAELYWQMNPSSPHLGGIAASRSLETTRSIIKRILNTQDGNIIFTSGGTEANNIALLGFATTLQKQVLNCFSEPWEHPSVLEALKHLQSEGLVNTHVSPRSNWQIPASGHVLVTLSHVSHETGDINDIKNISADIRNINPEAVIHIDGVQGFCKETVQLNNISMYSASSHKFHGSGGAGFLFVKKGLRLKPLFFGGSQENGLRPGTEPVNQIINMGQAAEKLHANSAANRESVNAIKSVLANLSNEIPDTFINSLSNNTSPYILNMSFLGLKGEVLVHLLAEKGIYTSMGAACKSRKKDKSALESMGFSRERAESAIRFSFSHQNTMEEVNRACEIISECVTQLRKI